MEHFIRTVFWIATLSGCLQARSIPKEDFDIDSIRAHVKCPSDSRFYAPTNVQKQCITTALDCVMKEFNGAVREECEDPKEDINQALDFFVAMIEEQTENGNALTNSRECECEKLPEMPFSQFLNKTHSLIQLGKSVLSSSEKVASVQ